jgi:hypothetical protein
MLESFYKSGSFVRDNINRQNLNNNDVRVYAEQAGLDTFYRIIIAESKPANYDGWKEAFLQGLIYELNGRKTVLVMNEYNKIMVARTDGRSYTSIDIVTGKDRAKGITTSYVYAPHVGSDIEKTYSSRKGQFYGETMLLYFRMEDFTVEMEFPSGGGSGLYSPDIPSITVHASDCLIDRNIPLRYGIQSAFDGDPATSYVENTEDDLMEIDFSYGLETQEYITRIGLINGYAQNMSLYKNNNRIKKTGGENYQWNETNEYLIKNINGEGILKDDDLSLQFINTNPSIAIKVLDIYRGDKYNDTCIAEFNMFTNERGWLFGGVDE